ncbi:putative 40s ribosomal protein s23 [Mycena maculata]|uniref:40s ribosomal protein s23 n=1 Tax=Mycena maculata TaxID=230809 RepID=A0AAD7NAW4_9AGAR|nr:putative 40s ribosomal protein s23 [Mycena maculata]
MSSNKPRGLLAARKLRNLRLEGIWRDRIYKRPKIYGTSRSVNSTGIQLEKLGVEAKQSNSLIRHGPVRAHVTSNRNVFRFVPTDYGFDLSDNSDVPISPKHKRGVLPRVHFKVVKVSGVGILSRRRMSRKVLCLFPLVRIAANSS